MRRRRTRRERRFGYLKRAVLDRLRAVLKGRPLAAPAAVDFVFTGHESNKR
jgi:hypothetical protein